MSEMLNCEKHGNYEQRETEVLGRKFVTRFCPGCAAENEAAKAAQDAERKKAQAVADWERKLGSACIPERFAGKTLDRYVADSQGKSAALTFARKFADGFDENAGKSAVFIGKPGTGKTHLSVGISLAIMDQGRSALFLTVMRAIRRIKGTWGSHSEESEADAIASMTYPDLLILDEVGVQFGSDTEKLLLFEILNERYENRKPTILLSNLSLPEISGYLGERVFDRLREDGGEVIIFNWESYRGSSLVKVSE